MHMVIKNQWGFLLSSKTKNLTKFREHKAVLSFSKPLSLNLNKKFEVFQADSTGLDPNFIQ